MKDNEGLSTAEVNLRGFAIEVARYWPRRGKCWLEQLADVCDKDVVFVCGDAHVESFSELLTRNAINSKVLARHIGVTKDDDEFSKRVLVYLEAHPELRN